MPTRPGSDLIPLRKATKERLAVLKGSRSYDGLLRALLDAAAPGGPPEGSQGPSGRHSHPDEQLALAALAARRWQAWLTEGRVVEVGPRLLVYRTRKNAPRRSLRVEWSGRRGFAP